ncbi:MAG: hypothetical protein J5705_05940 [Bacteroidaceae bacterium]|nr:hypothetical protein [Bacteroidaceae bacterium]
MNLEKLPYNNNSPESQSFQLALNQIQEHLLEQTSQYFIEIKAMIQNLETKMRGDIIESGGIKNINYNYYGTKDTHDSQETVSKKDLNPLGEHEQCAVLMKKLIDNGLIDEDWHPLNLSGSERGLLAKAIADHLEIKDVWQVFGRLWNEKPHTLRNYFNRAYNQKKSLEFQNCLKNVFR